MTRFGGTYASKHLHRLLPPWCRGRSFQLVLAAYFCQSIWPLAMRIENFSSSARFRGPSNEPKNFQDPDIAELPGRRQSPRGLQRVEW